MHPSEMEPTTNIEASQSEQTPHAARHARLSAFGAIASVCLIVALFAALMLRPTGTPFGVTPTVPTNWQTYRDPRGLFNTQIPEGWTASVETSTATFGDNSGSATETEEATRFSDPALGDASARLYVIASPIHSDFERHWYCQSRDQASQPHNISAETLTAGPFLFSTANAHFQVSAVIPHVLEPLHSSPALTNPPPTPTPLPQQVIAADRTILATILDSFQPADATPLSCF